MTHIPRGKSPMAVMLTSRGPRQVSARELREITKAQTPRLLSLKALAEHPLVKKLMGIFIHR